MQVAQWAISRGAGGRRGGGGGDIVLVILNSGASRGRAVMLFYITLHGDPSPEANIASQEKFLTKKNSICNHFVVQGYCMGNE